MQPNNPLTDLNIKSILVCYVYARLKRWVLKLSSLTIGSTVSWLVVWRRTPISPTEWMFKSEEGAKYTFTMPPLHKLSKSWCNTHTHTQLGFCAFYSDHFLSPGPKLSYPLQKTFFFAFCYIPECIVVIFWYKCVGVVVCPLLCLVSLSLPLSLCSLSGWIIVTCREWSIWRQSSVPLGSPDTLLPCSWLNSVISGL